VPITKSAKKAIRSSARKAAINRRAKTAAKKIVRDFKKNPSKDKLKKAYSTIDRLVKKNILHQNKAGRVKSKLAKSVAEKVKKAASPSPKKKAPRKKSPGAKKMVKKS